jgi:chemotaxis family two-component system response regulator Rcp1
MVNPVRTEKPPEILLVEDNQDDIFFMKNALKQASIDSNLHIVRDGFEALDFLYKKDKYSNSPRPELILLDINLPRKDGIEVLKEIKNNPELRAIPVIILTSSKDSEDINKAYNHYANSYINKPVGIGGLVRMANIIRDYWTETVTLPSN